MLEVFNRSIEPMLKELSIKLSEFDSLFKSKTETFSSRRINGVIFYFNLNDIKRVLQEQVVNTILYTYELSNFRKGGMLFSVKTLLSIGFHQNVYEIQSADSKFNLSKLYHQDITESETAQIVEELGTYIVNEIEKQIGVR